MCGRRKGGLLERGEGRSRQTLLRLFPISWLERSKPRGGGETNRHSPWGIFLRHTSGVAVRSAGLPT